MATIPEALAVAVQYHQDGRLHEAEQIYRQVLQADPNVAEAWWYIGLTCMALGRLEEAEGNLQQAVRLRPELASAWSDLGIVLFQQGKLDEAVASLREAVRRQPDHVVACDNLGVALARTGRCDEAAGWHRQALQFNPNSVGAHNNLGLALMALGQLDEAADHFRQAIQLLPDYADAYCNLALLLARQGRRGEAAACYRHALQVKPDYAEAHFNLGSVLREQGNLAEAEISYRQALLYKPDFALAYNHLGLILRSQSRSDEAAACLEQAVRCKPDFVEAYNNLGMTLKDQGRLDEAVACMRQAVALDPGSPSLGSNLLLFLQYHPGLGAALFEEHQRWACQHAALREAAPSPQPLSPAAGERGRGEGVGWGWSGYLDKPHHLTTSPPHDRTPVRRLRIGYVSPDFYDHPVAWFLAPILAAHDHERFEIICYADVGGSDAMTNRLRQHADGWRSLVNLSDVYAAELIRQDGIDILVDLAGHMGGNRLLVFARKPAPVQVTYLGFPNTTGLQAIDYRLTDAVADPPGEPVRHSEELVRLPGGFCCFAPPPGAPPVAPLPARSLTLPSPRRGEGRVRGHVTFGSLHNLAKLNAGVLDLWCCVLQAVPSARLLVYRHPLAGPTRERLLRQFTERGIAPDRLDLRGGGARRAWTLEPLRRNRHIIGCVPLERARHGLRVAVDGSSGRDPVRRPSCRAHGREHSHQRGASRADRHDAARVHRAGGRAGRRP